MRKKLFFVIIFMWSCLFFLHSIGVFPIVLGLNKTEVLNIKDTTCNIFNPLKDVDFSSGNNIAYLYFERIDINNLPYGMKKSRVLECKNNDILIDLKKNFVFEKSGGDMSTCESKIVVYKNNNLVFSSSFILTENTIGLQNQKFGWSNAVEKRELEQVFYNFKPSKKMFILLQD